MENILDVSKHIQSFKLELVTEVFSNMKFQLLELTQDLKVSLMSQKTYADMLDFAADAGVCIDRVRACDDVKYQEGLESVWALAAMQDCGAGTIKKAVGEMVCEISGLTSYIEKVNEEEVKAEAELLEMEESEKYELDDDEIAQAVAHPANA